MKKIVFLTFGAILFLLGIALGLYVGVWYFFVGGIVGLVEIVNQMINGSGVDGYLLGISIVRIMCASMAGVISAFALIIPSLGIFDKGLS